MSCRAAYLGTAVSIGLAFLSTSCTPRSPLERTKDHLDQARENLVRTLGGLVDDIEKSLTEVDEKLADPTLRPEERAKLLEARSRLISATDKAATTIDRQLSRGDLMPEERESLLTSQTKVETLQARFAMTAPVTGPRSIQRRLAELGYKAGPADGIIGPRTRSAIRAFERDNGMAETGEITPQLINALAVDSTQTHSAGTK